MKRKEKTVLDGRSNTELATETFNSTELPGVEKGQKLQVTVRLESKTIEIIEDIQKKHDFSFAEAVRRIVRKGLSNQNSKLPNSEKVLNSESETR